MWFDECKLDFGIQCDCWTSLNYNKELAKQKKFFLKNWLDKVVVNTWNGEREKAIEKVKARWLDIFCKSTRNNFGK
jgi:hypothetical protein